MNGKVFVDEDKIMRLLKILLVTLLFTFMYSLPSFAEWKGVAKSGSGTIYYVDFNRIRKQDGFVYYWYLMDAVNRSEYGDFSVSIYGAGDCNVFRFKRLTMIFHKEKMGMGKTKTDNSLAKEWSYPLPSSADELVLKSVCKNK